MAKLPVEDQELDGLTATSTQTELADPELFKVRFHNDDFTPLPFVIEVLTGVFRYSKTAADRFAQMVHEKGTGIAGIYEYEVAESKTVITENLAKKFGFPLHLTIEPDDGRDRPGPDQSFDTPAGPIKGPTQGGGHRR